MEQATAPLVRTALAPYLPWESVRDEASRLGAVEAYGRSVEGRPLFAVRVGTGPIPLVLTAAIHGLEFVGVRVALEVLRRGPLPDATLWVVPVANPDAYARVWRTDGDGPVGALRKNARGVDLNRNFPLPWNARPARLAVAGSPEPDAPTYRGEAPLSEPESRALADLLRHVRPQGAIGLHSFMGSLIPARVKHLTDWFAYRRLCRAFQLAQPAGVPYVRLSTPVLDVFTGELEDWLHHVLGCWAVCVECFRVDESLRQHLRSPSAFWRFNPRDPDPVVARDAPAVRALLSAMAESAPPTLRPEAQLTRDLW